MGKNVTLGGERLGSGNKQKIYLHGFERSTHDLGFIWRSTMAPGTLIPFLKLPALPGDTFDINLNANVMTLPTVSALFGSFKLQLDIFQIPIRLYSRETTINKLGIGLDMSKVKFPTMTIKTNKIDLTKDKDPENPIPVEIQQIEPSSLLAYLGIRGNGHSEDEHNYVERQYNALPLLMYWDIYKNYYSNKQEEKGAVLSSKRTNLNLDNIGTDLNNGENFHITQFNGMISTEPPKILNLPINNENYPTDSFEILIPKSLYPTNEKAKEYFKNVYFKYQKDKAFEIYNYVNAWEAALLHNPNAIVFDRIKNDNTQWWGIRVQGSQMRLLIDQTTDKNRYQITAIKHIEPTEIVEGEADLQIEMFPLENIDKMKENILKKDGIFNMNSETNEAPDQPYLQAIKWDKIRNRNLSAEKLNGIGLKTYQSDIFNNWLNTEWIDSENGINAITAIDTSSGSFKIDTLNMAKKVHDMLNRIAVSGGTYDDWLSAVYSQEPFKRATSPVYCGGLSKEIIFQEVLSNAETEGKPLATIAGKGTLSQKHKGGYINIKVDEPSYLIGIVSITPRIDYSQGNDWDVKLRTFDDLHKPSLDEIGFQDLITEQMAFWESHGTKNNEIQYSAGKQPAWLNYMTAYNKTFGNFANPNDQMFMTLNRKYEIDDNFRIKDLTTYIDPQKFNYIFADTNRDAQNFWVQIGIDIEARRKMSAKVMPNL